MRSVHAMPFGAEVLPAGGVRYALWAPGASRVELRIEEEKVVLAMAREPDGWARVVTDRIRPGMAYRYRIDGAVLVPDPASRFQPADVHGPSEVVDPRAFDWTDDGWTGRPWPETVLYELHVGAFTRAGTFLSARERLDHLVDLGVTAVELMPLADFPGRANWGYDGVLPFAPDGRYGRPDDLKAFVDACHARRLAVFLDVVYNHFGPEGNYLGQYAPDFFNPRHQTPWGAAINFDGPGAGTVRAFFRENALYWLEEFHFDGLRLDAVHAIHDGSRPHILDEIAAAVHAGPGRSRHVHLVLENDANEARYLRPDAAGRRLYAAQWSDDVHHAAHILATGERGGYYADYPDPVGALARCLTEGVAYQGEFSPHRGRARGEPTAGVPLTAFVSFLQNHDQIGNRAFGERLSAIASPAAVEALTALMLLAPAPPLLFMGQEWDAAEPFLFFCDFGPDLARAVAEGRRREFAHVSEPSDPAWGTEIPDPQAESTMERSVLDWGALAQPPHRERWRWTRDLLRLRRREIVPRLGAGGEGIARATASRFGRAGLVVAWSLARGGALRLVANLAPTAEAHPRPGIDGGRCLFAVPGPAGKIAALPPWYVAYYAED